MNQAECDDFSGSLALRLLLQLLNYAGDRPPEPCGPPPGRPHDPYGPPPTRPPPRFDQVEPRNPTVTNPAATHAADTRYRDVPHRRSGSAKRHRRERSEGGRETEQDRAEARSSSRHSDSGDSRSWQPKANANRWSNATAWTAATWNSYASGDDGSNALVPSSYTSMFLEYFTIVLLALFIAALIHVILWAWENRVGIAAYTRVIQPLRSVPTPRLCTAQDGLATAPASGQVTGGTPGYLANCTASKLPNIIKCARMGRAATRSFNRSPRNIGLATD